MATITWEVTSADTGVTPNASGAFTPAQNDLLVVIVQAAASVSGSTEVPTASANGITFVKALQMTYASGANSLDIYVAEQFVGASPVSMTVSWAPADSATGTVIDVYAVSGMSRVGSAAVKQTASGFGGASSTPSVSFGAACQTGNPTILAMANGTNPNGVTVPTGWSNVNAVVAYSSPTTGYQGDRRNSGFVGTSISWGSASASIWGAVGIELDTSAASQDFTGTATLTGDGTLSTTQLPAIPGSAALSGSGSLGTTGIPAIPSVPIALSGSGTLDASGVIPGDIVIRQQIDTAFSETAGTPLTLTAAQVDDTVVVIHADDYYAASDLLAPGGTAVSTWTLKHTLDGGTNDNHCKVWVGRVTTAGGTVTEGTNNTTHERYFGVWVLAGAVDFKTAASTDSDATSTSHVAPSVTPSTGKTNDLLICLFGTAPNSATNYTSMPGGMTARTERDAGVFCTFRAADQKLASDSASGTRTATSSATVEWFAVSVLMETPVYAGTATLSGDGSLGTTGLPSATETPALTGSGTLSATGQVGSGTPADVASSTVGAWDNGGGSVNVPAGTVNGDLLIAVAVKDGDTTVSNGTLPAAWTPKANYDGGAGSGNHIKVWYRYASNEPASYTYTGPFGSSSIVFFLRITNGPTSGDPFDATLAGAWVAAATINAPSVSPAGSDSLLICGASSYNGNGGAWTPPGTVTELQDTQPAAGYIDADICKQKLTSSGATGTRTFTPNPADSGIKTAWSFAIKSGTGTGSAFSGTATLSGSGSLGTGATPAIPGGASLSGSGSLGVVAAPAIPAVPVALSGSGSLSTVQKPIVAVPTAFSGDGTLSATGMKVVVGTADLSGSGTLAISTQVPAITGAIAALTGSGTLATGPHIPSLVQAVALSGSGALATTQIPGPKPAVALSGDGVLSTTQKPILAVAVALSGDGVLSAVAGGTVAGTAALTGSGTLAALQQAMTALGTAALTGSGTLTTTRIPAIPGIATLSGSGVLAITGKPILAVVSALSGDGTLAVTTFRPALVAVAGLSGVGILSTTAFVTFGVHTATLTGSGILSAAGTIPTSTFKVWNGSAWIAGILKRWDGSVWTTAVVKRWNGSSWVSI